MPIARVIIFPVCVFIAAFIHVRHKSQGFTNPCDGMQVKVNRAFAYSLILSFQGQQGLRYQLAAAAGVAVHPNTSQGQRCNSGALVKEIKLKE